MGCGNSSAKDDMRFVSAPPASPPIPPSVASAPSRSSSELISPQSRSSTFEVRAGTNNSASSSPNNLSRKSSFDPQALRRSLSVQNARGKLASPRAAYTVESLFKAAHEGHDMGRKAALLFDKFDADHNGILDHDELTALTKAMLENTLKTLLEANRAMVDKAIRERPFDEDIIRTEAQYELDMIVPFAKNQIARADVIAKEISEKMDSDGNGTIDKEEFINQITDCLRTYADFDVC